jgi:chemotaxis response regulator CheB
LKDILMPRKKQAKNEPERGQEKKTVSTKKKKMRTAPESSATASFPIVGIGASAGGLEAFTDSRALPLKRNKGKPC